MHVFDILTVLPPMTDHGYELLHRPDTSRIQRLCGTGGYIGF